MLRFAPLVALFSLLTPIWSQSLPSLTVNPATLSFTYVINSTTFPAAQTVQIKASGSTALDYTTSTNPPAPWLILTPASGKTGGSVSVRVNPSTLIAGTYTTVIQVDATGSSGPASIAVTMVIKNPPPTMAAAPATLSFTFVTDQNQAPASQSIVVSTNGEPVSFTAAATGTWLSISPAVGIAVSGSPITITASVDTTGLVPGPYTGKITLTSLNATNKSIAIGVSLTVNPGLAVVTSIWPNAAPIGSNDVTITVRGNHLFKASDIKAGTTSLVTTWISINVMLAVIPKAMMTAQGTLNITVTNSGQSASVPAVFTVTPPGPQIQMITNAASFTGGGPPASLSPGEIITIFGSAMGPASALIATPAGGAFPTQLGSPPALVEFEIPAGSNTWVAAPLIMVQANQINLVAPYGIPVATGNKLRVTYNNLTSTPVIYNGVAANPGIFTVDASGSGQAAALNYDTTKQTYSLNSASNPAIKGGVLVVYVTGGGTATPAPTDGQIVSTTQAPPTLTGVVSATINGDAAAVTSATLVPGAIPGLVQINLTTPATSKGGKDLPLLITIGGVPSPLTATVSLK